MSSHKKIIGYTDFDKLYRCGNTEVNTEQPKKYTHKTLTFTSFASGASGHMVQDVFHGAAIRQ
jgi:hypothetical protein